jgi:hypothetical protein
MMSTRPESKNISTCIAASIRLRDDCRAIESAQFNERYSPL